MEKILTGEQKTEELNKRLKNLSKNEFGKYLEAIKEEPSIPKLFDAYTKRYEITKNEIVKRSGLSKSYAYEILNGVKANPSRNHLIALCMAAKMDINTTQYTLKVGGVGELYAKVSRDAAIIMHINQKKWNLVDLNIFLEENGMELL